MKYALLTITAASWLLAVNLAEANDWYSNQRNSAPPANPYSLDQYRIPSQLPQRTAPPPVGSSNTTPTTGGGSVTHYGNGATCTNNRMKLIYEENYLRRFLQLVHHCLHTLFKLTPVFCASNKAGKVKRDDAFAKQHT